MKALLVLSAVHVLIRFSMKKKFYLLIVPHVSHDGDVIILSS